MNIRICAEKMSGTVYKKCGILYWNLHGHRINDAEGMLFMKKKLVFSGKLYLGDGVNSHKLDKIKKRLLYKPIWAGVFLITLSHNPSDQLDIFDCKQLIQHYYDQQKLYVVGIASGYEEALTLIEQITRDCLQTRRDCNLKEFLLCCF